MTAPKVCLITNNKTLCWQKEKNGKRTNGRKIKKMNEEKYAEIRKPWEETGFVEV